MSRCAWMTCGLSLLCALPTLPLVAAEISLREDGWYRWEVPAGAGVPGVALRVVQLSNNRQIWKRTLTPFSLYHYRSGAWR